VSSRPTGYPSNGVRNPSLPIRKYTAEIRIQTISEDEFGGGGRGNRPARNGVLYHTYVTYVYESRSRITHNTKLVERFPSISHRRGSEGSRSPHLSFTEKRNIYQRITFTPDRAFLLYCIYEQIIQASRISSHLHPFEFRFRSH